MKAKAKRLRPGELDGLVLAYLKKHKDEGPLTAGAIAKGISRSSGAIADCLARLAKEKRVRQAKRKPRSYRPQGATGPVWRLQARSPQLRTNGFRRPLHPASQRARRFRSSPPFAWRRSGRRWDTPPEAPRRRLAPNPTRSRRTQCFCPVLRGRRQAFSRSKLIRGNALTEPRGRRGRPERRLT